MVDIQQYQAREVEQDGINPFNNPTPGNLTKTQKKDLWEQAKFTDVTKL